VVGTSTHFTGARTQELVAAWISGDTRRALELYQGLLPVYRGVFATQGAMMVKAALAARGFHTAELREPLIPAAPELVAPFLELLDKAGL
jgi:4-hydroxy-tetrahydrodipicolinate synthase